MPLPAHPPRASVERIIPEATYKRRRSHLTADESERAERLARIFHPMLQGRTPLDVSMTELGARRVEALLWKLYYGIAA